MGFDLILIIILVMNQCRVHIIIVFGILSFFRDLYLGVLNRFVVGKVSEYAKSEVQFDFFCHAAGQRSQLAKQISFDLLATTV